MRIGLWLAALFVAGAAQAGVIGLTGTGETVAFSGQTASSATYTGTIRLTCDAECHVALSATNASTAHASTAPLLLPANEFVEVSTQGATRYVLVVGTSGNLNIVGIEPIK